MSLDFKRFDYLKSYVVSSKNLPNPVPNFGARYPVGSPDRDDFILALTKACEREKDRQYIGVEVELEKVRYGTAHIPDLPIRQFNTFWETKEDGSLRDNGAEFVSNKGLTVELLPIALHALKQYIKIAMQAGVTANARTGLHVHFNVGGMDLYTLCNILFLYAVYEPVFFFVSGNRSDSIFSVPWQKNRVSLGNVITSLTQTIENVGYAHWRWRNYSKYCALNLSTIETYGTIEFRMHEGTTDDNKIERWVKTINSLFAYAKSTDLIENIQKFRSGRQDWKYLEGLFIIFSEYTCDIFAIREQLINECKAATLSLIRGFVNYDCLPTLGMGENSNIMFQDNRAFNLDDILGRNGDDLRVRIRQRADEWMDDEDRPEPDDMEPEQDGEGEF